MKAKVSIFFYTLIIPFFINAQELKGLILDKESLNPIPFATVEIKALRLITKSDIDGNFKFSNLPKTGIELHIKALDYESKITRELIDSNKEITIRLINKHQVFETVTVSVTEGKLQRENITSITSRTKDYIFEFGATTLGEALSTIPGVQQNTIGTGISRPVIRGLSGMRVVTYWDGLRIENQQWGEDHGMATTELTLENIEVVKGPASLMYGADALGGVIHYSDESFQKTDGQTLRVNSKFETNAHATKSEIIYKAKKDNNKINLATNFYSNKDYQIADGRYLENSRFHGGNLKAAYGFRKDRFVSGIKYHGSFNNIGIPAHTHDANPSSEEFLSNRQGLRTSILPVQRIDNHFINLENHWYFNHSDLILQAGNTTNNLKEFDHDVVLPFTNLRLNNTFYNVRYNHHITEHLNMIIGTQGMMQFNRNRYPSSSSIMPDANSFDNGLYWVSSLKKGKWRYQLGARIDHRTIESLGVDTNQISDINISNEYFNNSFLSSNYALGMVRNSKKTTFRMNISSGFRAPNIAELLADGVHHGSLRYEKGNTNLKTEQAIQLDLAMEIHLDHLELVFNPYINIINDFIYLERTDSIISNNVGQFRLFEFKQVDRALLYGGEVGLHYHPHKLHNLHLESNFSLVIGQDQNNTPLNLMPQPKLTNRIRVDLNHKGAIRFTKLSIEHQYFVQQDRVADFELTTPAFNIINLSTSMKIKKVPDLSIDFGVRNLMNHKYITHLSPLRNIGDGNIPQPGINFYFKASYKIL